jgi:hypothetical protein
MGIFVTTFSFKHLITITKGYTTKQIHSIKVFENEIKSIDKDNKTLNIIDNKSRKEYNDNDIDNDNRFKIHNKFNNVNENDKKIKFLDRIKNLYKFYLKKTPKSLIRIE